MLHVIRRFFRRRSITAAAAVRVVDARAWKCMEGTETLDGYGSLLASTTSRSSAADLSRALTWEANARARSANSCETDSSIDPWVHSNRARLWDIETFSHWDHLKC